MAIKLSYLILLICGDATDLCINHTTSLITNTFTLYIVTDIVSDVPVTKIMFQACTQTHLTTGVILSFSHSYGCYKKKFVVVARSSTQ